MEEITATFKGEIVEENFREIVLRSLQNQNEALRCENLKLKSALLEVNQINRAQTIKRIIEEALK
jgi:hypothetical protein